MSVVSGFWTDAGHLFEVAAAASTGGAEPCDLAIVIQPGGAIRMLDASGWRLSALAAHAGADTAYRVTRQPGRVRVEGTSGARSCLLETALPSLRAPLPPPRIFTPGPALVPVPTAAVGLPRPRL
jgi:hypothetical protein